MTRCQVIRTRDAVGKVNGAPSGGALQVLLQAVDKARGTDRDIWQCAPVMRQLKRVGIPASELQHCIDMGWVAHAIELPSPNGQRQFQCIKRKYFTNKSCFVLTEAGERHARRTMVAEHPAIGVLDLNPAVSNGHANNMNEAVPRWSLHTRILSFGGVVVKMFKRRAPHQELILTSFQELNWSEHLDDPIPPEKGVDTKGRLHDTIKKLNRNHFNPLIRFYGDGTGRGICWERNWNLAETGDET